MCPADALAKACHWIRWDRLVCPSRVEVTVTRAGDGPGGVAACPDEQPAASAAAARSPSGASGRTLRDGRFMFSSLCCALRSRGIREWPEGLRLGLIG